jgi:acyl-CoA synthetase (AMP-forming)/AMP-acid ligase II
MNRPSKKAIREAIEKLHEAKSGPTDVPFIVPKTEAKKPNKNRIRKQGV